MHPPRLPSYGENPLLSRPPTRKRRSGLWTFDHPRVCPRRKWSVQTTLWYRGWPGQRVLLMLKMNHNTKIQKTTGYICYFFPKSFTKQKHMSSPDPVYSTMEEDTNVTAIILWVVVVVLFFVFVGMLVKQLNSAQEEWAYGEVHELDETSLERMIQSGKQASIMFYAPWCPHCRQMKPLYRRPPKRTKTRCSPWWTVTKTRLVPRSTRSAPSRRATCTEEVRRSEDSWEGAPLS